MFLFFSFIQDMRGPELLLVERNHPFVGVEISGSSYSKSHE